MPKATKEPQKKGGGRKRPVLGQGDRMTDRLARLEALLGAPIGGGGKAARRDQAPAPPPTPPVPQPPYVPEAPHLYAFAQPPTLPPTPARTPDVSPPWGRGHAASPSPPPGTPPASGMVEARVLDLLASLALRSGEAGGDPFAGPAGMQAAAFGAGGAGLGRFAEDVPAEAALGAGGAAAAGAPPLRHDPQLGAGVSLVGPLEHDPDPDDVMEDLFPLAVARGRSNPGNHEVSLFDDLPPLPSSDECNGLLGLYFEKLGKVFPFMHRGRFSRTGQCRHVALTLSMLSFACRYHSSITSRAIYKRAFLGRLERLFSQLSHPSLYNTQALIHFFIDTIESFNVQRLPVIVSLLLAGHETLLRETAKQRAFGTTGMEEFLAVEEARRTMWLVGYIDKMFAATHLTVGRIQYEEVAMLELPAHEAFWDAAPAPGASTAVPRGLGLIPPHAAPSLDVFYDVTRWPAEERAFPPGVPGALPVGSFALMVALQHALSRIIEFRTYCSRRGIAVSGLSSSAAGSDIPLHLLRARALHADVCGILKTWYSRFNVALGASPGEQFPQRGVAEPFNEAFAAPWTLVLWTLYHALWVFFVSPISSQSVWESSSVSHGTLPETGASGTPAFIASWMQSDAFVTCLDHAREVCGGLALMLERHGDEALPLVGTPWWGWSLAMSTITLLVAMKEVSKSVEQARATSTDPSALRIIEAYLDEMKAHATTTVRAMKAVGRVWKPGLAAAQLVQRLYESLEGPRSGLIDWVAARQGCVMLHVFEEGNRWAEEGDSAAGGELFAGPRERKQADAPIEEIVDSALDAIAATRAVAL